MTAEGRSRWVAAAVLPASLILWVILVRLFWPFTQDDAFILFRYARNWAAGRGLVYNLSGPPADGYTSFAWVLWLAWFARLGSPANTELLAKIFGALLGAATLVLVWRLPGQSGRERPTRWIALLLTAVSPAMVVGSIDGLETPLYTFVALALVWLWLRDARSGSPLTFGFGLVSGYLTLVRPDGVLLALLLALTTAWRSQPQGGARRLLPPLAGFALLVVPWFVWHDNAYGHPLPNTAYVKFGGHPDQLLAGLLKISATLKEGGGWATILVVIPAFLGPPSAYVLALLAAVVARVAFTIWSGGEVMGHFRFLAPALPAYFLLLQHGMDELDRNLAVARGDWARSWTRRLFRLAPLVLVAYVLARPLVETRTESLRYMEGLRRAHVQFGYDARAAARPGAKMAIGDAGAAPYVSGLDNIDILGLNDRYLAHLPGRYTQKIDVDYVLGQAPEFVVVVSRQPPERGFVPEYVVDGRLRDALLRTGRYFLWKVYPFKERYFLWAYRSRPGP